MTILTREAWLGLTTARLRAHFIATAATGIPENLRASCGWPSRSALAKKSRRMGEHWAETVSADGKHEIFISPLVADGLEVAAILAHECVHAAVGSAAKHGPAFRTVALAIGLTGKMTATVPADRFRAWYNAQALPDYPHGKLDPSAMERVKQATRLLKVECGECAAEDAPYIVRMSAKTLEMGAPICPIHGRPMTQSV